MSAAWSRFVCLCPASARSARLGATWACLQPMSCFSVSPTFLKAETMNPYQPMISLISSALTKLPLSVDCPSIAVVAELTERGVWLRVSDPTCGIVFGRKGRSFVEAWTSIVAYATDVTERSEHTAPWPERDALINFESVTRDASARYRLAKDVLWCATSAEWHLARIDALIVDQRDDLGVARDFKPYLVQEADNADRTE